MIAAILIALYPCAVTAAFVIGVMVGHRAAIAKATPAHKPFADIAKELQDDFDRHGK